MPNLIPGLTRSQVEEYYKHPEVQQLHYRGELKLDDPVKIGGK